MPKDLANQHRRDETLSKVPNAIIVIPLPAKGGLHPFSQRHPFISMPTSVNQNQGMKGKEPGKQGSDGGAL